MSDNVLSLYYNVHINGVELSKDRKECIKSINISENCGGSDTCTLVIEDPNFLYIEDNIFIEEATIYVEFGWWGYTHRSTFFGYISAIDITFPENGYPQLSIYCLDVTHLMNREKKTRSWDNVTSADVVKKIAAEYGFSCVVESGYQFKKQDTISQSGVTDIEFCENLAGDERDQFMCKLKGNTLYYVKLGILQDPSADLDYRSGDYDVVSFSPQINKETRKEKITAADINTDTKATDTATASDSTTAREVQGEPVQTSSTPQTTYTYDPKTGQWIASK